MKNKDFMNTQTASLMQKLTEAMKGGNETAMTEAFTEYAATVQQMVINEANIVRQTADTSVLSARGVRQLTSAEREFYQKWIDANRSGNPKQALVDIDKAIPETIIESVVEDIKVEHPLLNAIDFKTTTAAIKMLLNADETKLANWGALNSAIAQELSGKLELIDTGFAKLAAFIPIAKDMLDLGAVWLDAYVRLILTEAIAAGLEHGIICGTGKAQPIGMIKNLDGSVTNGVYPDKDKVVLKSLSATDYCAVIAPIAKKPHGGFRVVPIVAFIVNPVDYIQKVLPASTVRAADGSYSNNIFPYPTEVIQSTQILQGSAVIGLANKYFMVVGASREGAIEYSDEYQFLEDNRVYLTKLHGNGRPKDNNAFVYVDISELAAENLKVEVVNTPENLCTPKQQRKG